MPILSTHFTFMYCEKSFDMRINFIIIGIGLIMMIFGIIFYLQGNSIVGPTSSFMYSNPKWIINGQWIAIGGGLILSLGLGISLLRPKS